VLLIFMVFPVKASSKCVCVLTSTPDGSVFLYLNTETDCKEVLSHLALVLCQTSLHVLYHIYSSCSVQTKSLRISFLSQPKETQINLTSLNQ